MSHDPYDPPSERLFECIDCGTRVETDHQQLACTACGGDLRDLSVPREQ